MHFSTTKKKKKKPTYLKKAKQNDPPQTLTLLQDGDNLILIKNHFYFGVEEGKLDFEYIIRVL